MLKAAIEKIQQLSEPIIFRRGNDEDYIVNHNGEITQIRPEIDTPDTLTLYSLDALVKMVKSEASHVANPLYINIPTHMEVNCFGQPQEDKRYHRQLYYKVKATDVPGWDSSTRLLFEQAAVALQTRFQENEDRAYTLQLLSQITTGAKVTTNDNGIATSVVTHKGVTLQQNVPIRPLVRLRPYRTFQEIAQPEGLFLIRIDDKNITFTEADGGMWKLDARKTIANYLLENLEEYVEDGRVIIAL